LKHYIDRRNNFMSTIAFGKKYISKVNDTQVDKRQQEIDI